MEHEPRLIIFKGQPATGKSTLAEKLSQGLGWQLIVRDKIKEEFLKQGLEEDILGKQSYDMMWNLAKSALSIGDSCILDTNLNQKIAYNDLSNIKKEFHVKILIIECFCSDETVHKRRFYERNKMSLSKFWIKNWDEYQTYLKSYKNDGDFELTHSLLRVDTSRELDIRQIEQWVGGLI